MGIKISRHDIGAEIISILTKGMYPDPCDALREYVQNGVDAGAKNIEIKIRANSIVVEDDGSGMDEATMKKAVRVGISDKNPKLDVGFRGIGIYSSFHLCDSLVIYSRPQGEETSYLLGFDFKGMREILHRQETLRLENNFTSDQFIDLQSLLEKHIHLNILDVDEFPKEGTRVEMINLDPNFFKSLSKFEIVADYLRQVVPLHFHPDKFRWSGEIEDKIDEICKTYSAEFKLINLTLQVNTQIERLFRPYADEDFEEGPLEPLFKEIQTDGHFFGVAWGCLNSARKKIKDKELRGFLIKKQGFAIGKRINVAKYFGKTGRTTFFDRYIGEIIVVHPDLLPNAPRTDFESSFLRTLFYEALSRAAIYYNDEANKYQEYTKGDERLNEAIKRLREIEANISFHAKNTEELLDIIVEVRNIREQIDGRIKRKVMRQERKQDAEKVLKAAKDLEREIRRFINQSEKNAEIYPKEKLSEVKSIERIRKLPDIKQKELFERQPGNLAELFDILDLSISDQQKIALEVIDEKFIQALATNKAEYLSILKNLKEEIEDLLAEE